MRYQTLQERGAFLEHLAIVWRVIKKSAWSIFGFSPCREDNSVENKPWISIRTFDTAENEFSKV